MNTTMKIDNRVWIELERPEHDDPAAGDHRATLANNMLERLAKPEHLPMERKFFYDPKARRYCFGGDMGYRTLTDHGEWFNLDYLGRLMD